MEEKIRKIFSRGHKAHFQSLKSLVDDPILFEFYQRVQKGRSIFRPSSGGPFDMIDQTLTKSFLQKVNLIGYLRHCAFYDVISEQLLPTMTFVQIRKTDGTNTNKAFRHMLNCDSPDIFDKKLGHSVLRSKKKQNEDPML